MIQKTMRLNPYYQAMALNTLGLIYLDTHRYEEAIGPLEEARRRNPALTTPHHNLAIVYSELGREEEARAAVAEFSRLAPTLSLERVKPMYLYEDRAQAERAFAALRKAGLK